MNFVSGFIRFSNLVVHHNDIMDLGADVGFISMQAYILIVERQPCLRVVLQQRSAVLA